MIGNNGLRVVIERRGDDLYWNMTLHGVEHTGNSRGPNFEDCGREINQCLRFLKLGRQFEKQREARSANQ